VAEDTKNEEGTEDVEAHNFDDLSNVDDAGRAKEGPDVEGHLFDDLDNVDDAG
jgi:hypothetical protein